MEKSAPEKSPNMEAQFAAILADASKQYSSTAAKGSSLDDFLTPPMKSIEELKQQLVLQNDQFAHFRAKRQKIFDALGMVLKPVEVVGEIVAEGASEVFPAAQGIYGAVMYLINAAHDITTMYDSILELFDQLKDFTSRLDVYVRYELTPALREKLVSILAAVFETLVIATHVTRQGRIKAYFKRLAGSESPVQPALQKLNALTLGEERQVIAETYGGVGQLNLKTDRVEGMMTEMSQSIHELRLSSQQELSIAHRDKLKEILEPTPFAEDNYTAMNRSRVQGTGDWLLEDEGLKGWLNGETRHLWLCGSPGTGKSFLTTKVLSWAQENLPHIAYFFFSDNDPETRSVLQALHDVAYQLSERDAWYAEKLMRQLHGNEDIKTVASSLRRLFEEPFVDDQREKNVYVFLDGIDEAEQNELDQLLSFLAPDDKPKVASKLNLQFALIGRSYMADRVSVALDPDSTGDVLTTVYITPDRIRGDVSAFIADGVRHSRILSQSTEEFKKQVIQSMEERVDGLFILAKFMLSEINRKRHPSSILKSLESFPTEINGMLNKTLADLSLSISDEEAQDLHEMLQWVACAEESLTLEQLEAALVLKFGDPPFRLEEEVRGQYACFFNLEREDGLTTDDLLKDFARTVRESNLERNGGRTMSPGHRLSSSDTSSPARRISPAGRSPSNRQTSPALSDSSPCRHFSPVRSPGIFDTSKVEFRSNPATTYVTFFHTSVRQFFRDGSADATVSSIGGNPIGFDISAARVHILKTCLKIFNDKTWFESQNLGRGKQAMKQYAAWYWQEHLTALEPTAVSSRDKTELGMQIYNMITDESIIFDWSIMYEKNNEGLELLTDNNINGLKKWLTDPEIIASLTPEAQDFIKSSSTKALGVFEPLGRYFAKAWLSDDFHEYIPTLFCFKIVQNIAFMNAGQAWSQGRTQWSEIPIDDMMAKATAWANFPQTAHWYSRVGSTYLMLGMYGEALAQYDKALELDAGNVQASGRVAYCLSMYGRYHESLAQALRCAEIEESNIQEGKLQSRDLKSCKWRLYKDYLLVARCSYLVGNIDSAHDYYKKAIDRAREAGLNTSEIFEPETSYFTILAAESDHKKIIELLEEMSLQIIGHMNGTNRLTDLLLDQYTKPLVMDWIPKAACKTGKVDFLLAQLESAIDSAHHIRDPLGVLYLRLAYGTTCAYNRDIDGAIEIFEQISLVEYRPRGNVPARHGNSISFQKLAALYKHKILQSEITSSEAAEWIQKLENVQERQSKHQNLDMPADMYGSDVNVASIYLALFYRLLKRDADSRNLLMKMVINSLDILLDDEPRNDEYAVENLVRVFIAAADDLNAQALAQSIRKINPKATILTPTDSPVRIRIQPKLPDIQSVNRSCAQCLENISPSDVFVICRLCLDSYCLACLEGVIKQPGNKISDRLPHIACRSDHDWLSIPPLNRLLHTGEILWIDDQVKGFMEWENALRVQWRDDST